MGVLDTGERDAGYETGLKEGSGIEMSTTVLSIYAMHALFALNTYLNVFALPNASNIGFDCNNCRSIKACLPLLLSPATSKGLLAPPNEPRRLTERLRPDSTVPADLVVTPDDMLAVQKSKIDERIEQM